VVPRRRGVHGLLGLAALAVGAGVSALPAAGDHGGVRAGVALRGVRQAGLPDRGDDLPGHPHAVDGVVRRGLVYDCHPGGVAALTMQRLLGLGSYQTVWAMLHRYRTAMVRPGRELLAGRVEVDETFLGGEQPGVPGRGALGKTLVVVAVELHEPRLWAGPDERDR